MQIRREVRREDPLALNLKRVRESISVSDKIVREKLFSMEITAQLEESGLQKGKALVNTSFLRTFL